MDAASGGTTERSNLRMNRFRESLAVEGHLDGADAEVQFEWIEGNINSSIDGSPTVPSTPLVFDRVACAALDME